MKSFLHTTVACTVLLACTVAAEAQNGKAVTRSAERQALVQNLVKGQTFASDGMDYQLVPEVRAVRAKKSEAAAQLLPALGARSSDLIEHRGSLVYFRRATRDYTAARVEPVGKRTLLPVAVDVHTGQLVMLPGSIIAKPKDMNQAQQIAADYGLVLTGSFPHLQTATYEVRPGQDVLSAAQALARDGRVNSAEPEVQAALREPR